MSSHQSIDLRAVARLARLRLTDEELRYFETQVAGILEFVEKLNELKGLESVQPTSHPLSLADVFRDDVPRPSTPVEPFLKHAPKARGRFFEVPKVIEGKD